MSFHKTVYIIFFFLYTDEGTKYITLAMFAIPIFSGKVTATLG
jgi:hypothetical protein